MNVRHTYVKYYLSSTVVIYKTDTSSGHPANRSTVENFGRHILAEFEGNENTLIGERIDVIDVNRTQ